MPGLFRKKIILFFAFILFCFGIWGVYTIKYEKKIYYKDLDVALKEKATKDYLEQKILDSIKKDKFADAVMYKQLADYLKVDLGQKTLDEIEKNSDFLSQSWRKTKSFASGYVTGESENTAGMAGSIISDMTVVGDIRDLTIEGTKYINGKPYDEIVFGMAGIGIGLTASQAFSAGATTPAKVGASIIKIARKTGKLTKSFTSIVLLKLRKVIDFKQLKKIDFSSFGSIKKAAKKISGNTNIKHIRKYFDNINRLKKNTSILDSVALLKYVDDPKDLQKVVNISQKYKKNTKGVFKVLGKKAVKGIVKGTAKIVKYTNLLIMQIVSLVVSLIVFLFVIIVK